MAPPARAETDWFASLYTNEGVELRADERVFALYALLNGMGYDEAPVVRSLPVTARDMPPVRLKVRSQVRIDDAAAEKLNAFFNAHPKAVEAYGRYALALKGPLGFERTPAAPADLKGFETLLAEGWKVLQLLFALPGKLDRVLSTVERGALEVRTPQLSRQVMHLERSVNRVAGAVMFGALVLAGAILTLGDRTLGGWLMAASVIPLLWTLFGGRGHRPRR